MFNISIIFFLKILDTAVNEAMVNKKNVVVQIYQIYYMKSKKISNFKIDNTVLLSVSVKYNCLKSVIIIWESKTQLIIDRNYRHNDLYNF